MEVGGCSHPAPASQAERANNTRSSQTCEWSGPAGWRHGSEQVCWGSWRAHGQTAAWPGWRGDGR
eukprot:8051078-Lingulodinium_polyedra.AAC.1